MQSVVPYSSLPLKIALQLLQYYLVCITLGHGKEVGVSLCPE